MERDDAAWGQRVRSAVVLAALVAVLGAASAAVVGVLAVALTSFVDQALG